MSRVLGLVHSQELLESLLYSAGTECIHWPRYLDKDGYGRFWVGGKRFLAHRAAYEFVCGEIPAGLTIDHLCRNRACINPTHLEAVTQVENMLRARRDTCANGHPMIGNNVGLSKGRRSCRACGRVRSARYKAKRAVS